MAYDILHRVHDFGHSGLVVGTQQGCPVGGDYGLSLVLQDFREVGGLEAHAFNSLQGDVRAVVVLDYLGSDAVAGGVGRGVHVGDEAYSRDFGVSVGGYGGHHIAPLVELGFDAHGPELVP